MESKANHPKRRRLPWGVKILLGIGGLAVIFMLTAIVGAWYLRGKLPDELKQLVRTQSKGVYTLDFDQMRINLIAGNVRLKGLNLRADTNQYRLQGDSAKHLFNISAEEFSLRGIRVWDYVKNKKLYVEGIQLDHPKVQMLQMSTVPQSDSTKTEGLLDKIPTPLKGLRLAFVEVNQLSFSQSRIGHLQESSNRLPGLSFRLEDVFLDSTAITDTSRIWFSKEIELESEAALYHLPDSLYQLRVGHVALSTVQKRIHVESFQLIPSLSESEFSRKLGTEGDRYEIKISNIILQNLDFKGLETTGRVFADSLLFTGGDVKIYNDKTYPETGKNKIKNAPHLALQRLQVPVYFQTLALKDFNVSYREKTPVSNQVGNVFFTNLNGAFSNITNDSAALQTNHWASSHFEMDFLDKAKVRIDLNLDLSAADGTFAYKGSMAPSAVSDFNALLEPMAMIRVTKGYINGLHFNIKGNVRQVQGSIDFQYKDLAADILIRSNDGSVGKRGLLSFLANELVIQPNNPSLGEAVRLPRIQYVHPPTRSFFNLMWKGVFEGIQETVNAYGKDAKTRREAERKVRREARKERREQRRNNRRTKEE